MSNLAHRLGTSALLFALGVGGITFRADGANAQSTVLPDAQEPWLAQPGDADEEFNEAQTACYQGSMEACDAIWLNGKVLLDSSLGQYGRTCGGRVDLRQIRRANLTCSEAFPD
jgi:hypothetical protein